MSGAGPRAALFCLEPELPFLPGASSGTSDVRSRSRPKKWWLRNTGHRWARYPRRRLNSGSLSSCLSPSPSNTSCLLSHISCIRSPVSRLLYHVSCLYSPVFRLLSNVSYLTSLVSRLQSHVSGLTYPVSRIQSHVSRLTSAVM